MNKLNKSNQPTFNQRLRTRKDLLLAASSIIKSGRELTIDEVAKVALVSRATAYRYFSDVSELVIEVGIDDALPAPQQLFDRMERADPVERLEHAESVMHDFICKNEAQLRLLLSHTVNRTKSGNATAASPVRQNRRSEYIKAALAPVMDKLNKKSCKKLSEALALVFGPEAHVVFNDVLQVGPDRAREVKQWMIKSLVHAALKENREA